MTDLKKQEQRGGGNSKGIGPQRGADEDQPENEGADFGTTERATRGTNRDFDDSGESMNQGHGHPREERG